MSNQSEKRILDDMLEIEFMGVHYDYDFKDSENREMFGKISAFRSALKPGVRPRDVIAMASELTAT